MARAEPCSARCSCGLRSKRRAACRLPQRARLAARRCAARSAQRGYRGPRHRAVETGEGRMRTPDSWIVVGLDCGGTSNNATVLDASGRFLVDRLVETPSLVQQGPDVAVEALVRALDQILERTGMVRASVRALGLDTPGPASADGVISSKGATNFSQPAWRGFDFRGALQARVGLPVVYNNDANAAALYAHHVHFGPELAAQRSSVSVVVGTVLGGGVIESGRVVRGAAGMAGELGHIWIPMAGLLAPDQPVPQCNCGLAADA